MLLYLTKYIINAYIVAEQLRKVKEPMVKNLLRNIAHGLSLIFLLPMLQKKFSVVIRLRQLSKVYLLCETKKDDENYMDNILNTFQCEKISKKNLPTISLEANW